MRCKRVLLLAAFFCTLAVVKAADYELKSPNEKLIIKLQIDNGTKYEIWHGTTQLISPSTIGLNLDNGQTIGKGTIKSTERNTEDNIIPVTIGKNKELKENYNELIVHFNENYDLVVRAYDEGIAYRFVTAIAGDIIIKTEDAIFNFVNNPTVFFPEADNLVHWEKAYTQIKLNSITSLITPRFGVTPILFSYDGTPYKVVITEADVYDYPGLYIQKNGSNSMKGMWAKYPKEVEEPNNHYSNHQPISRYDYIANTSGTRSFPWRVIIATDNEVSLLNNELVYMLAEPSRLTDTDWIKPGKSAWEWWHKAMLTPDGKADPAKGIPANGNSNLNYNLFRYYIDFAAANNIQYLTLDAGSDNDKYSMLQLCNYAKSKGVKIILWTWASCVVDPGRENWMAQQKERGISGFKVDFFNRSDQLAMRWAYQMAEKASELGMVLNYHGCPVPTGLNRTYPNILNFEAVLGNEENFWRSGSDPLYHVSYPYIRSLVGPADYTPGSMRNKSRLQFTPIDQPNIVPSSQGTRAHELAMYVVFDHWMGYLCDAPTEYQKYPDILSFLAAVPVVWDKTLPLDGKVGEYILMAKQTGKDWFVGGMTNWSSRNIDVDFKFLTPGVSYEATVFKDGLNASSYPVRYDCDTLIVTSDDKLSFSMAQGGGFVIQLKNLSSSSTSGVTDKPFVYFDRSTGMLHVKAVETIRSIQVYNLSGQCLFHKALVEQDQPRQINLSQLDKGAYIVKIQTESVVDSVKFIY